MRYLLALALCLLTPGAAVALETGVAEVLHADPPNRQGTAQFHTYVRPDSGGRFLVATGVKPYRTDIQHGDRVLATRVSASGAKASASGWHIEPLAVRQKLLAAPFGSVVGTHRAVLILVNFTDKPIQPKTPAEIQSLVAQTSAFYKENSFDKITLPIDPVGWYTLPLASTGCPYSQIQTLGDRAATAAGVDLRLYQHRIYFFPLISTCPWGGLGSVGGNPAVVWMNGTGVPTMTHELGHNLGLYHSHRLACGPVSLAAGCPVVEYGDATDTMGSGWGPFNPPQKEILAWATPQRVTASGSYALSAYKASGQALRIARGTTGQSFYVALLEPRPANEGQRPVGVHVWVASDGSGNAINLLDMSPENLYWPDSAFPVGRSFEDGALTITTRSIASDRMSAVIDVALAGTPVPPPPPPTCPPNCPPPPPPIGDVATQTFTYQGGGSGKFPVRAGGYTCERWMNGSIRISRGTTLLKVAPLKNAVRGVPFTLTCAIDPARVVLSVDGSVKLTAGP